MDTTPLASLERKLQLVKDRVTAVARGYQTGLYLFGSGGLGKSHTVLTHLDALEASYKQFNSRISARGLFRALERAPDAIHILEDMERLTQDRDAQGVLRSALWAQPGRDRVVTWTTEKGGDESFAFRGGIILLANRPLASLPELRALATRIAVMRLEVTDAELRALVGDLCGRGYVREGKTVLAPEQCREVAEYMLGECGRAGCPLDLRLLVNSFHDYLVWDADLIFCHWQDLVSACVREAAHHFHGEVNTLSQEERRVRRRKVLRVILRETTDVQEQERLYCERTGKSRADFFRRKGEVQSGEFDTEETET
jgi:hypothetical protein